MSDRHLRELERLAARGNPDAVKLLQRTRCRAGQHCRCLKDLLTAEEQRGLRRIVAALRAPASGSTPLAHVSVYRRRSRRPQVSPT